MRDEFGDRQVRYFIGDARDRSRMTRAVEGADIVVHDILITSDEARHAIDTGEVFVVLPEHSWWDAKGSNIIGRPVEDGFTYSSDNNLAGSVSMPRDISTRPAQAVAKFSGYHGRYHMRYRPQYHPIRVGRHRCSDRSGSVGDAPRHQPRSTCD